MSRPRPPRSPRPPAPRHRARTGRAETGGAVWLYGLHAVEAALRNPARRRLRLLATQNAARGLAQAAGEAALQPEIVTPRKIDAALAPGAVHQGAALLVEPLAAPRLSETLAGLRPGDRVLALDQVTDPHNVGAILRSAAAFGVVALITTERRAPGATGVVAKTACGALERVPWIRVGNLAEALGALGEAGCARIGLDERAEAAIGPAPAERPAALILGAEGAGLRARTRANCDILARLPTAPDFPSLNVSNTAAVALYALNSG